MEYSTDILHHYTTNSTHSTAILLPFHCNSILFYALSAAYSAHWSGVDWSRVECGSVWYGVVWCVVKCSVV